mgnify:CR=1 FL=1
MKMKNNKWYRALVLVLDVFAIACWIYFLVISFNNGSSVGTKIFWVVMEAISIFNFYRDCMLLVKNRKA